MNYDDWIVADARTQQFRCERCGARSPMPVNILIDDFVNIGNRFAKKHADCKDTRPKIKAYSK